VEDPEHAPAAPGGPEAAPGYACRRGLRHPGEDLAPRSAVVTDLAVAVVGTAETSFRKSFLGPPLRRSAPSPASRESSPPAVPALSPKKVKSLKLVLSPKRRSSPPRPTIESLPAKVTLVSADRRALRS
jgi:hypothetical protein